MENDRELLEYAAKAALVKTWADEQGVIRDISELHKNVHPHHARVWNPLTDDGDALRLAVKLRMDVDVSEYGNGHATAWAMASADYSGSGSAEDLGDDPYAATRRAIVRAAAAIGKDMK